MSFNPNIPGASDFISTSQSQIQTNFAQSNSIFDIDHVTFDDATTADRGKHRKTTFISSSAPTTGSTEVALYSKGATPELWFRRASSGSDIQMTVGTPIAGTQGSTFLPGGLILKWGEVQIPGGASTVAVNFVTLGIGNFPTAMFLAIVTPFSGSAGLTSGNYPGADNYNTTGFNIRRNASGGALDYKFIAIGN